MQESDRQVSTFKQNSEVCVSIGRSEESAGIVLFENEPLRRAAL